PEVGSLPAAQEQIEAVGMTGAVMAGETIHAESKEHPPDIRRDLINPVQTVQAFVIVRIRPQPTASGNVADGIIERDSRRETLCVFSSGCEDVRKNFVVRPVHLQPLLCPEMKLRFPRSEQLAKVIGPLVGEFLGAN